MLLVIALQAIVFGPPAPRDPTPRPPVATRTSACPAAANGDVVVCAKVDQEPFRLRRLPQSAVTRIKPLSVKLPGGATASPQADGGRLSDLQAKVGLTLPF